MTEKSKRVRIQSLSDIRSKINTIKEENEPYPNIPYPQADNLLKVIQLVENISKGNDSKKDLSRILKITQRQIDYYGNAAQYLGFVCIKQGKYSNTSSGKKLAEANNAEKERIVLNRLFAIPSIRKVFKQILPKDLSIELVIDSMRRAKVYLNTKKMEKRRAQSIHAWIVWALSKL